MRRALRCLAMERTDLTAVLARLLADSELTHTIALDAVGEAIGTRAVSTDEIDALFSALEAQGRSVVAPQGGEGEKLLGRVVSAARELKRSASGPAARKLTIDEVARHAGLERQQVISALALLHIMQR